MKSARKKLSFQLVCLKLGSKYMEMAQTKGKSNELSREKNN